MTNDFNLLAFAQGKSRAESNTTLYFNEAAARRVEDATSFTDASGVLERYVVDREAFDSARADIKASAVTIHLKGLDEGRVDEIRDEFGIKAGAESSAMFSLAEGSNEEYLVAVLAEAFDKAVDAQGNEDTSARPTGTDEAAITASRDYWKSFKKSTPSSQWPKLLGEVVNIIFVSYIIDEAVDAGFLADSSPDQSTLQ